MSVASDHHDHGSVARILELSRNVTAFGPLNWLPCGLYLASALAAAAAAPSSPTVLVWDQLRFSRLQAEFTAPPPPPQLTPRYVPARSAPMPRYSGSSPGYIRPHALPPRSTSSSSGRAARAPSSRGVPPPQAGLFCSRCHLHGWGVPRVCPRCNNDPPGTWHAAHAALGRPAGAPPDAFMSVSFRCLPHNQITELHPLALVSPIIMLAYSLPRFRQASPIKEETSVVVPLPHGDHPVHYSFVSRSLSPSEAVLLPAPSPDISSWAAVSSAIPSPWSPASIRLHLLTHLKGRHAVPPGPFELDTPAEEPPAPRFHARDSLLLLQQYLDNLANSPLRHLYSRCLDGPAVSSPLKASGFWDLHAETCAPCAARGPWPVARRTNAANPCWIADVLAIVHNGWVPVFDSLPPPFSFPNAPSLDRAPIAVRAEHDKSIAFGAVIERPSPFVSPLINAIRPHEVDEQVARFRQHGILVSPEVQDDLDQLNTVIAEHASTIPLLTPVKTRLCIDLSRVINKHLRKWPFSYYSIQDALSLLSPGSYIAKLDMTRMFQQLPLHPAVMLYFAYRFLGRAWTCVRTPFGGTSTPAFANLLAGITALLILLRFVPSVFITDDSLYTGRDLHACRSALQQAISLMERLGWLINPAKIEGPAQQLVFLGIQIDTVHQTLGISAARLATIIDRLDAVLSASSLTVRAVQSIAGRLQWIAAVFPRGRPYMAALYGDAKGDADALCRLSPLALEDLRWWRAHLHDLHTSAASAASQAAWVHYSFDPLPRLRPRDRPHAHPWSLGPPCGPLFLLLRVRAYPSPPAPSRRGSSRQDHHLPHRQLLQRRRAHARLNTRPPTSSSVPSHSPPGLRPQHHPSWRLVPPRVPQPVRRSL